MRLQTLLIISVIIYSCGRNQGKSETEKSLTQLEYLQKGAEIVNLTQSELLKNVSAAIQTGGPGYAIDFCSENAMLLKDSLSRLNNCVIRRIASRYRNPADKPQTKTEKDQLNLYQEANKEGHSLAPEIVVFDDRVEYYQPIFIDRGACLICHGSPGKQIADETLEKIKERYPGDLATGYAMNDFRGAWKITFMKNEE